VGGERSGCMFKMGRFWFCKHDVTGNFSVKLAYSVVELTFRVGCMELSWIKW
jgi:hypothetical protein